MINFKKKRGLKVSDPDGVVGTKWYRGFMKRFNEKIKRGSVRVKDVKRHTWVTYNNLGG